MNPSALDLPEAKARGGVSPKLILKILISVVLLGWLLHKTGLENTLEKLSRANLWYAPVGVLIYLLSQAISAYRWRFLSAAIGIRMSFARFYEYYLLGMFFSLFLPGSIGGDMLRVYYMARHTGRRKREALLTLLAERGVGLVALLLLTSLVCLSPPIATMDLTLPLALPGSPPGLLLDLRWLLLGLSGMMLAGYLVLLLTPLAVWLKRFPALEILDQARVYWAGGRLLSRSVLISLSVHGLMIGIHALIALALDLHINLAYLAVTYGVVSLASVLPIAFNGFGVREGAYLLLLTRAGLTPESALAFAFYWVLVSTATSLVGGGLFLRTKEKLPASDTKTVMMESGISPRLEPASSPFPGLFEFEGVNSGQSPPPM